jgi:hypothetical protein
MLTPTFAQKTLIATVCSICLLACGQKSTAESDSAAASQAQSAPAHAAAPAAAPAPRARAADHLAEAQKMKKEDSESLVQDKSAGGIDPAAMAAMPAGSAVALKGRQLVLTASARFGVKNTYQSTLAIEDAVVASDGFVVSNQIASSVQRQSSQPTDDGQLLRIAQVSITGHLLVRVPSHKAQAFLREIASQIEVLDQRTMQARDVQFDMLRSQLEAARNQDAQTDLGSLTQQRGTVGDKTMALEARNAAKASRDEARLAQAQLADQVAFSTIALDLYQPLQLRQTVEADFDKASFAQRPGFISSVGQAVASGWHGLLKCLLWMALLWPLWIALLAMTGAVVAYRQRAKRKLGQA